MDRASTESSIRALAERSPLTVLTLIAGPLSPAPAVHSRRFCFSQTGPTSLDPDSVPKPSVARASRPGRVASSEMSPLTVSKP